MEYPDWVKKELDKVFNGDGVKKGILFGVCYGTPHSDELRASRDFEQVMAHHEVLRKAAKEQVKGEHIDPREKYKDLADLMRSNGHPEEDILRFTFGEHHMFVK